MMPTRDEWIRALITDYSLKIISSDDLVATIANKQEERILELSNNYRTIPPIKRNLVTVGQFNPEKDIRIRPIDLLHRIGLITTPAIQNLADISSTWAIIRYIWAFDVSTTTTIEPLRLSNEARNIDFHQKALLSDEVGMGMASYIMANIMNAPNAIDVKTALKTPTWNVIQNYRASPDYLFFDKIEGDLYIVECKGNQTSRSSTFEQLRRGTEQVPSITFSQGRQATSLIIGTCMLPNSTEIYVIDPPGEKDGRDFLEPGGKAKRTGSTTWEIVDSERFKQDIDSLDKAKKLTYAGFDEEAVKQLDIILPPSASRFINKRPPMEFEENEYGDFQGVRFHLPTSDGITVDVFKGLLHEVAASYIQKDDSKTNERLKSLRNKLKKDTGNKNVSNSDIHYEEQSNATVIRSIGPEGTILQVKLAKTKH